MWRWQLDTHWQLLNLHFGVGSELLLAFDPSLTYCSEFRRVPDLVEQWISVHRWENTKTMFGCRPEQTHCSILLSHKRLHRGPEIPSIGERDKAEISF